MRILSLYAGLLLLLPIYAQAAIVMQIDNLSDMSLPIWSMGDPSLTANMDICVYSLNLTPVAGYAITVSSNPSGFLLKNGTSTIPYSLSWVDGGAGNLTGSGTALSDGAILTGQLNANILSSTCALSTPTARLILKINQTDMTSALSGTYSGTITFLLTAN